MRSQQHLIGCPDCPWWQVVYSVDPMMANLELHERLGAHRRYDCPSR